MLSLEEYKEIAIRKVIGLMREQGLKYRRTDFKDDDCFWNNVSAIQDNKGIIISCYYNFERCGKLLKTKHNDFLNYVNVRVLDWGIVFTYSFHELDIEELRDNDTKEHDIERIMKKIQKLLALADPDKNPSEQEAIAASMQAQKLLAKYNLDIATVTGTEKKEEMEQIIADVGEGKKWRYTLASVVARSYCCKYFNLGTGSIVFYGYKSDCLIARRIFVYLFEVGNRLANAYKRNRREKGYDTVGSYNSFCGGFVIGVNSELSRSCKALMLVVPQEVKNNFDNYTADFKQVDHSLQHKDFTDADAINQGYIEGKRALNAQYIEG